MDERKQVSTRKSGSSVKLMISLSLKKLFEDHYIDVPDEKYDVLEDQASKIDDLEKKLNEEIEKNVEMNKVNGSYKDKKSLMNIQKTL